MWLRGSILLHILPQAVVRWRGQAYPLPFGDVELPLSDDKGEVWRWPAVVAVSPAPMRWRLTSLPSSR
jgi:hypothetical protein